MNERSLNLIKIRPHLLTAKVTEAMGADECFQNKSLRPILKLQNELLLTVFQNYIIRRKNQFYELQAEERLSYIKRAVQNDMKLRNSLKGMIIGQFTVDEYHEYIQNASALNKRIMNMVIKRLQNQIQYFEKEVLI